MQLVRARKLGRTHQAVRTASLDCRAGFLPERVRYAKLLNGGHGTDALCLACECDVHVETSLVQCVPCKRVVTTRARDVWVRGS